MTRLLKHAVEGAVLAACLALVMAMTLVITMGAMPPAEGQPVLVITAPWGDAQTLVSHEGGALMTPWATSRMVALVAFDGPIPAQALDRGGAWFVVDGARVARLCGVS